MRLIVLAAGQGQRLRPLTDDRPKCLVELGGRSLLDRQMDAAAAVGITDVLIVGGYRPEGLARRGARVILNPRYDTTNMVRTLFCAREDFGDAFIMSYGDIVYRPAHLARLLEDTSPVGVIVDADWLSYWSQRFDDVLSDAESLDIDGNGRIRSIGKAERDLGRIQAQYIGLVAFRDSGVEALKTAYDRADEEDRMGRPVLGTDRSLDRLFMTDLLQGMVNQGVALTALPVQGGWMEIDTLRDLAVAERLLAEGRLSE